ncbi:uncharacterized protein LOC141637447 [Silene latifolia]|uniref:uncharacterized protein LOC141637447 n=1 Tax=Silene latifolia TaxID=37657 RepID=UPI003D77FB96
MRQRRWIELIDDYDMEIVYHEGKANVMADILSRKSVHSICTALSMMKLKEEVGNMEIHGIQKGDALSDFTLEPKLKNELEDPKIREYMEAYRISGNSKFNMHEGGSLQFEGKWCIPNDNALKRRIMEEAHITP